jgi:hypothetical protein
MENILFVSNTGLKINVACRIVMNNTVCRTKSFETVLAGHELRCAMTLMRSLFQFEVRFLLLCM